MMKTVEKFNKTKSWSLKRQTKQVKFSQAHQEEKREGTNLKNQK